MKEITTPSTFVGEVVISCPCRSTLFFILEMSTEKDESSSKLLPRPNFAKNDPVNAEHSLSLCPSRRLQRSTLFLLLIPSTNNTSTGFVGGPPSSSTVPACFAYFFRQENLCIHN